MRARHRKTLRAAAIAALVLLGHYVEELARALLRRARLRRARTAPRAPHGTQTTPAHTDERTARRIAEAQRGGVSSAESAARWAAGDNPGGLHHKAVRRDSPEHPRPTDEEPSERKERTPGGEKHMPVSRRG
jgi:hypothetical protein